MTESPGGTHTEGRPAGSAPPIVRLLVSFLLDIADIARRGGSILDVLILTVVVEANVAELSRDPELQQRYAALDTPPPDALRRPVSVSAVAAAARLPYETVRRHLAGLAERGECVIGPHGVVVPTSRHISPEYAQLAIERYERTRRLYQDLRDAGLLDGPATRRSEPRPPHAREAPIRLCNRLLSEYYLRTVDLLVRRVGDVVSALILLGLARANMAANEQPPPPSGLPPEQRSAPVRRSALAAQLGLPPETVRRRLLDLHARGYCGSVIGGVVIDTDALLGPEARQLFRENEVSLRRFFSRLRRVGVLDLWDAEDAHASSS